MPAPRASSSTSPFRVTGQRKRGRTHQYQRRPFRTKSTVSIGLQRNRWRCGWAANLAKLLVQAAMQRLKSPWARLAQQQHRCNNSIQVDICGFHVRSITVPGRVPARSCLQHACSTFRHLRRKIHPRNNHNVRVI